MTPTARDYYALIARAVDSLRINVRETRLMLYEQARTAQLSSFDPAIPEDEFRHQRKALDQAILAVEKKAATADEGQARSDAKIVFDYAGFMAEAPTRLDCFYDASLLPYPKEAIIAAIEREIVRTPLEEKIELLQTAGAFMWNFLEGIGPEPRPIEGYSPLPRGDTPEDRDELSRIVSSAEYVRDAELTASLMNTAKRERKEVEERVETAIRVRREVRGQ
ncbi:MAG TPA: hypothetical protein VLZ74_11160 [Methylocella sp.]|nr:hypothetical protein [Methylocella sp.]